MSPPMDPFSAQLGEWQVPDWLQAGVYSGEIVLALGVMFMVVFATEFFSGRQYCATIFWKGLLLVGALLLSIVASVKSVAFGIQTGTLGFVLGGIGVLAALVVIGVIGWRAVLATFLWA